MQLKRMPLTCKNVGSTLRPLGYTFRRRVKDRYDGPTKLNNEARLKLAEAIFAVEDEWEAHHGSDHPQIHTMRAIRCMLLDDISVADITATDTRAKNWSENWPESKYSFVEKVARVIRGKQRAAKRCGADPRIAKVDPENTIQA